MFTSYLRLHNIFSLSELYHFSLERKDLSKRIKHVSTTLKFQAFQFQEHFSEGKKISRGRDYLSRKITFLAHPGISR